MPKRLRLKLRRVYHPADMAGLDENVKKNVMEDEIILYEREKSEPSNTRKIMNQEAQSIADDDFDLWEEQE